MSESAELRNLRMRVARAAKEARAHPSDSDARDRLDRAREQYEVARVAERIDGLGLTMRSRKAIAAAIVAGAPV